MLRVRSPLSLQIGLGLADSLYRSITVIEYRFWSRCQGSDKPEIRCHAPCARNDPRKLNPGAGQRLPLNSWFWPLPPNSLGHALLEPNRNKGVCGPKKCRPEDVAHTVLPPNSSAPLAHPPLFLRIRRDPLQARRQAVASSACLNELWRRLRRCGICRVREGVSIGGSGGAAPHRVPLFRDGMLERAETHHK
jgi:hypothetical protein